MDQPDTNEIRMLTAVRPAPPADLEQIRRRARLRLGAALAAAEPGHPARPARNRRKLAFGAAVAAAAAAAIAVPALLPGSGGPLVTRAWAVTRSPGGAITVTVGKALRDQAGLQRALRADGVPAYVRPLTNRCPAWGPQGGSSRVRQADRKAVWYPAPGNNDHNFSEIIIHPAALAKGDAVYIGGGTFEGGPSLQIGVMPNNHPPVCDRHGPRATPGS